MNMQMIPQINPITGSFINSPITLVNQNYQLSGGFFPPELERVVQYISMQTQAPDALICTSMLSAMAFACQGNIDVDCNGVKPVSLYTITVAPSGERKSTVDDMLSESIRQFNLDLESNSKKGIEEYDTLIDIWRIKLDALKNKYSSAVKKGDVSLDKIESEIAIHKLSMPQKPRREKILVEDSTVEALFDILSDEFASVLLSSNEGGTITKGTIFKNSPFLNKVSDGQEFYIDRKSAPSFKIKNSRLSISLMIQFGIFDKLLFKQGNDLRASGFLARCLICQPSTKQGTRYKTPFVNPQLEFKKNQTKEGFDWFQNRMTGFIRLAHQKKTSGTPKSIMRLSDDAQILYCRQYNLIEGQLNIGCRLYNFKDVGSRYMEQVLRIASILQYFTTEKLVIEAITLQAAINIFEYYVSEFLNIFKEKDDNYNVDRNAYELITWLRSMVKRYGYLNGPIRHNSISKNYIRQYGPNCIRNKVKLDEALWQLKLQGSIDLAEQRVKGAVDKTWVVLSYLI